MSDVMTPTPDPQPPALPYKVALFRSGPGAGVPRATKVYPDRVGGDVLTDDERAVWEYVRWLEGERAKLQAFKAYVHRRLDEAGVPADPEGPHRAAGCRVGGRLDAVLHGFVPADEGPGLGPTEFIPHDQPTPAAEGTEPTEPLAAHVARAKNKGKK